MRKIAFYGKGGIGKSTLTSSISAAIAGMGRRVMQIGCDPKADSTLNLRAGQPLQPVMDVLQAAGGVCPSLDAIAVRGYRDIVCVEAGGPTPGSGCAGRGIIKTFDTLDDFRAFQVFDPEYVFFDVLGDVVCGGFAMPLRGEYSDVVFVVTSGEMMSLYAASNIVRAVERFRSRGYARFGGYILNRRNVEGELENLEKLAAEEGGAIVADLPRSPDVQRAEAMGGTVVDALPESEMAACYRALAARVLEVCGHG